MLTDKSSGLPPDDLSVILEISDAAGMDEVEHWLNALDVLILTADAFQPGDRQPLASQPDGRLAVLLLADDAQLAIDLARLPLRSWGILPLTCSTKELILAVRALDEGLLVCAPMLFRSGLAQLIATGRPAPGMVIPEVTEPLTQRETEVLQFLALGLSNKQLAARLNISEHTVKFHGSSIYAKLGVVSRTEAVRVGLQRGIISL